MDPYQILGVSSHASAAEIKSAYRKLVKKFHPDVYKGNHADMIRQVNEAYDVLSDPVRKAAYDGRVTSATHATNASSVRYEYQEDPRKKQRREYVARRRGEARRRREEYLRVANATYLFLRYLSVAALLFASLIIFDEYLPQTEYREVARTGWHERTRQSKVGGDDRFSYMQTENFTIAVPNKIHIDYDYHAQNRQVLTISVSPILKIPSKVSLEENGTDHIEKIGRTIFSSQINIQYILFLTSLFVVLRRNYNDVNLGIALFPVFILVFIWLTYFP